MSLASILPPVASVATLLAVLALIVVAVMTSRREQGQHRRSSDTLWRELCRAHGLSRHEARLLRRTAERAEVAPPTMVFVEPQSMQWAGEQAGDDAEALGRLRQRLFGLDA